MLYYKTTYSCIQYRVTSPLRLHEPNHAIEVDLVFRSLEYRGLNKSIFKVSRIAKKRLENSDFDTAHKLRLIVLYLVGRYYGDNFKKDVNCKYFTL